MPFVNIYFWTSTKSLCVILKENMHGNLAKHTIGSKFVFVKARLDGLEFSVINLNFVGFDPSIILTNLKPAVILKNLNS